MSEKKLQSVHKYRRALVMNCTILQIMWVHPLNCEHYRNEPRERERLRGFSLRWVVCSSSSLSSELVLLTSNTISFPGSTRRKLRHSNVRCPAEKDTQSQIKHTYHSLQTPSQAQYIQAHERQIDDTYDSHIFYSQPWCCPCLHLLGIIEQKVTWFTTSVSTLSSTL